MVTLIAKQFLGNHLMKARLTPKRCSRNFEATVTAERRFVRSMHDSRLLLDELTTFFQPLSQQQDRIILKASLEKIFPHAVLGRAAIEGTMAIREKTANRLVSPIRTLLTHVTDLLPLVVVGKLQQGTGDLGSKIEQVLLRRIENRSNDNIQHALQAASYAQLLGDVLDQMIDLKPQRQLPDRTQVEQELKNDLNALILCYSTAPIPQEYPPYITQLITLTRKNLGEAGLTGVQIGLLRNRTQRYINTQVDAGLYALGVITEDELQTRMQQTVESRFLTPGEVVSPATLRARVCDYVRDTFGEEVLTALRNNYDAIIHLLHAQDVSTLGIFDRFARMALECKASWTEEKDRDLEKNHLSIPLHILLHAYNQEWAPTRRGEAIAKENERDIKYLLKVFPKSDEYLAVFGKLWEINTKRLTELRRDDLLWLSTILAAVYLNDYERNPDSARLLQDAQVSPKRDFMLLGKVIAQEKRRWRREIQTRLERNLQQNPRVTN